jgi:FMN phosphatase YigB (HAD superfamily)
MQRRAAAFDLYGTLVDIRVDEDRSALWEGRAVEFLTEATGSRFGLSREGAQAARLQSAG